MIRLICISIVLTFTMISCASSTRFPFHHRTGNDTDSLREIRYEKIENEDNYEVLNNDNAIIESRVGIASYYSDKYQGQKTSSGEIYEQNKLTAAHPSYALGTIVRVKNLRNRRTVIVRINDRMKDLNGRIIDLSKKAANELDMIKEGIAKVQIDVLKWGNSN